MLSSSQSFRIPLARREESVSISKAPASPPLPPLRKGGKRIARSRRHFIGQQEHASRHRPPSSVNTNFSPAQGHSVARVSVRATDKEGLDGMSSRRRAACR